MLGAFLLELFTTGCHEHSEVKFYDRLLDEHINKLSDLIGRKITKEEAKKVFAIVERYSPKLADGNIIDYFPFDLAWTLYKIIKKNNFGIVIFPILEIESNLMPIINEGRKG